MSHTTPQTDATARTGKTSLVSHIAYMVAAADYDREWAVQILDELYAALNRSTTTTADQLYHARAGRPAIGNAGDLKELHDHLQRAYELVETRYVRELTARSRTIAEQTGQAA